MNIGEAVAGLFTATILTLGLYAGGALFASIGAPGVGYSVSQGSAWFYYTVLVAGVATFVFFVASGRYRRLRLKLRVYILSTFVFAVTGMSLCNVFSIVQLFPKGH